jgi:hypothetical protein
MFRLLSEKEKNRSWVPFDNFFMTKEEYEKFLKQSTPYDAPVNIIKTEIPPGEAPGIARLGQSPERLGHSPDKNNNLLTPKS